MHMTSDAELSLRLYSFVFQYLEQLKTRIELIEMDLESFYMDLQDAYDQTGPDQERALEALHEYFQDMQLRHDELKALKKKGFDSILSQAMSSHIPEEEEP